MTRISGGYLALLGFVGVHLGCSTEGKLPFADDTLFQVNEAGGEGGVGAVGGVGGSYTGGVGASGGFGVTGGYGGTAGVGGSAGFGGSVGGTAGVGGTGACSVSVPHGNASCQECSDLACCYESEVCANNVYCSIMADCVNTNCPTGDPTCASQYCYYDEPSYQAWYNLYYCRSQYCTTECAGEPACQTTRVLSPLGCDECMRGSCCSQFQACDEGTYCHYLDSCAEANGCVYAGKYGYDSSCVYTYCSAYTSAISEWEAFFTCRSSYCADDCATP